MYLIFFFVCFFASVVGAVCGIGGGVIIKPVLDALGVLDVAAVSFLSGCTVLAMTTYSVVKGKMSGESHVETGTGIPLALGAAAGGIVGKWAFSCIVQMSSDANRVGAIQALCLLLVTVGTLLYTLCKEKIKTLHIQNAAACLVIGIFLGMLSSFLGIGGGPINLIVLFFFFSMGVKKAAENSLYIILFSQATSLVSALLSNHVPAFSAQALVLMVAGGICGGICGRALNKRIAEKTVERLFVGLMLVIILINAYNIYQYA
ncbi:MAG: sulfite exporter TauE/SafE family protein [Clostridiales bacterium]|nr:sulfite exporter TauE/SafE family protein [Clostridiales bacterium]